MNNRPRLAARGIIPVLAAVLPFLPGATAALFAAVPTDATPDASRLVYTTPSGITCVIDATGLSAIRKGDRIVAQGHWQAVDVPELGWKIGEASTRTARLLGPNHLAVTHVHPHARVDYDYVVRGEDLFIQARVSNLSKDANLPGMGFDGLAFRMRGQGFSGNFLSELADWKLDMFYPGPNNRIGCAWWTAGGVGLGLCPLERPDTRSLWLFGDDHRLRYFAAGAVPSDGARVYRLCIRLSDRPKWKHLLLPYKQHLADLYGQVHYARCTKPVAWISSDALRFEERGNDLPGQANLAKLLDSNEAARAWAEKTLPPLSKAGCGGMLFAGLGGMDDKGLSFLPAFSLAPPNVARAMREVVAPTFDEAGMRVGVMGYGNMLDYRLTRDRNACITVNPDDPAHLGHMWAYRLNHAAGNLGARMFEFPLFGGDVDDVKLMRFYREKLGPNVPVIAGQASDAILFYACGYVDWMGYRGGRRINVGVEPNVLLWLVPGASLYVSVVGDAAPAVRGGLLPLVPIGNVPALGADLPALPDPAPPAEPLELPTELSPPLPKPLGPDPRRVPEEFRYSSQKGPEFRVSDEGLTQIHLGDRTVCSGTWRLIDAGKAHGDVTPILREISIHPDGNEGSMATVVHRSANVTVTYDYFFRHKDVTLRSWGQDVTIRAYVENRHPSEAIDVATFGGLTVDFGVEPNGWMANPNYRPDMGHMHPGWANRIGGSYGIGEGFGVGATPLNTGLTRTLLRWRPSGPGKRALEYSGQKPIPPGGARTFYCRLRVSTDADWHHLLQPYKDHFVATYGQRRYQVDHRMMTQFVAAAPGGEWRSPDNPYGFDKSRRMDTPDGMKRYVDAQVAGLKAANGQGVVIWAHTGWDPRQCQFRTDFDLYPKEVEDNWHILRDSFDANDLEFGVCTRPGEFTYRVHWTGDNILHINPDDPEHLESNGRRFRHMVDRGCRLFYLDSYGVSLDDLKSMIYYRRLLGPDVQTFVEHPCDAILPYSGAYMEVRWDDKHKRLYVFWGLEEFWKLANWLVDSPGSCVRAPIWPWPKEITYEDHWVWLLERKLTLLEQSHLIGKFGYPDRYREVQDKYVDAKGQWK